MITHKILLTRTSEPDFSQSKAALSFGPALSALSQISVPYLISWLFKSHLLKDCIQEPFERDDRNMFPLKMFLF